MNSPVREQSSLVAALGRAVRPRHRAWLIAVTLLLGLGSAALLALDPPSNLTYSLMSRAVQSLMSIAVPLLGILLAADVRRGPRPVRVMPTLVAAVLVAAAIGALGAAFGAVALAASSTTAENPWHDAMAIPVCGVLVQVLAVLVGTGLGLLVGNRVIAFVETLVVPLALWLVLRPFHLENWLSPLGAQANLQGGSPSGLEWVQWAVVFVLWGVGLNAYGTMRRNRNG